MGMIKSILKILAALPELFRWIKRTWGSWKKKKARANIDKAIDESKKKKSTKKLQEEIGKILH